MDTQPTRSFWVNCRINPVTTISKALERGIDFLRQPLLNPKLANYCKHLLYHAYSLLHTCILGQSVSVLDPALPFLPAHEYMDEVSREED